MLIQKIAAFFEGLAAMSSGLPLFALVPLIMVLATLGTIIIVKPILWFIRHLFGEVNIKQWLR